MSNTITGTPLDDLLRGTESNDYIDGGAGNDTLYGFNGDDTIYGGSGDDILHGSLGKTLLVGGIGNDTYFINSAETRVSDFSGIEAVYVSASFTKLSSHLNDQKVQLINGAISLPYWIDALLPDEAAGLYFRHLLGNSQTFYFAFPSALPSYDRSQSNADGFEPFNPTQIERTKAALNYISTVINLQFIQTDNPSQSNTISFANNSQEKSAAYAMYPSTSYLGSDVFLNKNISGNTRILDGNYASLTLIHEIGHALGLKHPFRTGGIDDHPDEPPYLDSLEDNTTWTVMSYTTYPAQYQFSFSPFDIAALQYLYGPSPQSRALTDTYFVNDLGPNFIWDGGGIDVIDAGVVDQPVTIYLTPGYWGWIGANKGERISDPGQITVNFGTIIENLYGSNFADHLIGNSAGNLLYGRGGNDLLDGLTGTDTVRYDGLRQDYQVKVTRDGQVLITDQRAFTQVVGAYQGDGADILNSIELIQFADQLPVSIMRVLPAAQLDTLGYAGKIQSYFLTTLGRAANASELQSFQALLSAHSGNVWKSDSSVRTDGNSLVSYLASHLDFASLTTNKSNAVLVSEMYSRMTGTKISDFLLDYYKSQLDVGGIKLRGLANAFLNDLSLMPRVDDTLSQPNGWSVNFFDQLSPVDFIGYLTRLELVGVEVTNLDLTGNLG